MRINHVYVVFRVLTGLFAFASLTAASSGWASDSRLQPASWPVALREDMQRLALIEWRLRQSAGELCSRKSADFGLRFDYIGAYDQHDRPMVSQLLGMSLVPQVAVVISGSPGADAGIQPGDDLLQIAGKDVSLFVTANGDPDLLADAIEQVLSRKLPGERVELVISRKGRRIEFAVQPEMLCAARYVIKTDPGTTAYTSGSEVEIPVGLIRFAANDDELALIAGHELGHIVNRDGKPKNLAERRRMEDRADDLGAALAHCAGYDVGRALEFWERSAKRDLPGWLRAPTHRPARERAARLDVLRPTLMCPVNLAQLAPQTATGQ